MFELQYVFGMLYQSIILAVMAAPTVASVPEDNDIVSGLSFDVFKASIDAGGARGYFGMKIIFRNEDYRFFSHLQLEY